MVLIIFRDLRAVAIQETKKFLQIETVTETKKKQRGNQESEISKVGNTQYKIMNTCAKPEQLSYPYSPLLIFIFTSSE